MRAFPFSRFSILLSLTMKRKIRLEFPELLIAGVMVTTAGFALVLWRSDPRMNAASVPAAQSVASPAHLAQAAPAKTDGVSSPLAVVHSPAELSILPVAKGPKADGLDQLEMPRRVEVFEERRGEFLRMRMAELAEHAGGSCGCGHSE